MKLNRRDVVKLRFSLAVMLLMLALGLAGAFYADRQADKARTDFSVAQSAAADIDGRLRRVRNEEDEIRRKAALFNQLQVRGLIGEEQRLAWIELLGELRTRHQLLELRYEFSPQQAIEKDSVGTLGLYASRMKLQMRLLHEEDLTRLLDDLRQQAPALIQVKRCDMSRLPTSGGDVLQQGLLQADCLLDWLTLNDSKTAGGEK